MSDASKCAQEPNCILNVRAIQAPAAIGSNGTISGRCSCSGGEIKWVGSREWSGDDSNDSGRDEYSDKAEWVHFLLFDEDEWFW
jgi:hypothetical protein